MDSVYSKNNIPIRLTAERWMHIVENHEDSAGYYDEVLQTVENPDCIIEGYNGAFIALTKIDEGKFLAVVYKEIAASDGFVITAYFTRKIKFEREVIVWQRQH
ncbi:MAG TPA: hypothetical protein VJZ92_04075 [Thermodesulfobacteriota bacterium]|nr:hypothetical protein [Thermodesulfobacteriota bacterium]